MISVKNIRTPTKFEKIENDMSSDSRFQKVKIYIAHDGENLNNSVFSVDTLKQMGETLPYCPILGYVKINGEEDPDFGGHEVTYKITKDGIEEKCGTRAYGFIGEDNDAHIETTGGKNWLVCYGYLWTRFTDSIDIFKTSNGIKGQSMEVQDADGYVDDQGRVVFTSGTLSGLCILGDGVEPAMSGSTISTVFSTDGVKDLIHEMVEEFSKKEGVKKLSKKDEEKKQQEAEGKTTENDSTKELDKNKKDEKVETDEDKKKKVATKAKESVNSKQKDKKKPEDPEDSEKDKEKTTDPEDQDGTQSDTKTDKNADVDKDKDKKKTQKKSKFEISYEAIEEQIRGELNDGSSDSWFGIVDIFDNHVVVYQYSYSDDTETKHYYDIQYSKENDVITLGERTEVFAMYLNAEEKQEIESSRETIDSLKEQLKELTSFKDKSEMEAKNKELKTYESRLDSQQIKEIKSKFSVLTIEDLKKEIAYNVLINEQEQSQTGAKTFSRNFKNEAEKSRYGVVEKYFK